jgi:hypothetical protein
MAAAAVLFSKRSEVLVRGGLVPGIGTERNLGANLRSTDAHGIQAFGMQQVGNKFVIAFEVQIADVKENHVVSRFAALAKNVDGSPMTIKQRLEVLCDQRELNHFRQWPVGEFRDDARRNVIFRRRFDDERELRGRLGKFHGRLWRGVLRTIDDVAPVNELVERRRVEAEFFVRDRRDQFRAGFVLWFVEHVRTGMLLKTLGVLWRKESALMMIEPPGHLRRVRVFEVHDDVLVAVEQALFPRWHSAVGHAGEAKLRGLVEALAVETVKKRSRRRAIKATIVKAQSYASHEKTGRAFLSLGLVNLRGQSPLHCDALFGKSSRNKTTAKLVGMI